MKRIKYPTSTLLDFWKKNYERELSKFTRTTYLRMEDYMSEFKDGEETWKILGVIDGKEMACEKISTGEVFVWDRWQVSLLKHPEAHKRGARKIELIYPDKKKKKTEKESPKIKEQLFDENEGHELEKSKE